MGALAISLKKGVRSGLLVRLPDIHPPSFPNVGHDSRIYLPPIVSNCSGERSFSKRKMAWWTKEHH